MIRTVIGAIGLNCETHQVDVRLEFSAAGDGGQEEKLGHRFAHIRLHEDTDQAVREADDENAYWHDAEPIATDRVPLLATSRDALLKVRPPREVAGKYTVLNAVCVDMATNIVSLRLGLVHPQMSGKERIRTWHRVTIAPGDDVDTILAAVNADITSRPELRARPVDDGQLPLAKSICSLVHTKDVVASFRQARMQAAQSREARA